MDDYGALRADGKSSIRLVLPKCRHNGFITLCHDSLGHPGGKRSYIVAASRVWWLGMKADIVRFVGECPTCCFNKVPPYRGAMHVPENGSLPWEAIQIDIVHLHKTASGMEKAVIFYDRYTRDVEAFAVRETVDTNCILNLLLSEIVPRHSWPRVIYVDRGSNLMSSRAQKFYKAVGIDLRMCDSEMHTGVGGCERFNGTLRELARSLHFDLDVSWEAVLPLLVFWYKSTAQTAAGNTPFFLNHGRDAVLPWDIENGPAVQVRTEDSYVDDVLLSNLYLAWACSHSEIGKRTLVQQAKHDSQYGTNVKFKVGDRVLIRQAGRRTKMDMPYVGPFRVGELLERDRYRLIGRQGAKHLHQEFHVSRLKRFPDGSTSEDIFIDESYYDMDHVVDHRFNRKGVLEFRIRWVGYSSADDSWITMEGSMTRGAKELLMDYLRDKNLDADGLQLDDEDATQPPVDAESGSDDSDYGGALQHTGDEDNEGDLSSDDEDSTTVAVQNPPAIPSDVDVQRRNRDDRVQARHARKALSAPRFDQSPR